MTEKTKTFTETGLEIAVVGMAGRFPGARNLDEFWSNLKRGVESITFFTDAELEAAGIDAELLKNPRYIKAKGVLEDIESFDGAFFDYSPRESAMLDPQYRLLHEVAWEALEDAGFDPDQGKELVGVYAGATNNLYWMAQTLSPTNSPADQFQALQLNDHSFATRLSYKLNLKGPSVTVQTACSTSLVAVHLASQGLLSGDCDLALAGGVSLSLPHVTGYLYQEGMISSQDGHCRAFDEQATGTVFGEGAGMVVLKRLKDAQEDGDTIYAVIKGSAINNDGKRKVGYTAPSTQGQADVIRAAHQMAEVESESISYIEAHGTGTVLGDPIELEALQVAFASGKKGFCRIGSVKTNIGHLDAAAGAAGLIKTALALRHKQIPPSLNYSRPNPKIDFGQSPFLVNTELIPWEDEDQPLRAGVSSFGIGGTNAHVVLEEAPVEDAGSDKSGRHEHLIVLSAKTPRALEQAADNLRDYVSSRQEVELADIAWTLQTGRKRFTHRRTLVASDREELLKRLDAPERVDWKVTVSEKETLHPVFLFSGQGVQYLNMGVGLYRNEPVFRREVDRCLELIRPYASTDLFNAWFADQADEVANERINRTDVAQPLLFIFEYALAKLLQHRGIRPQAMIGHSIGEYVAACLAGVFSLSEALQLVALRGQLMQEMPAGTMLSVQLGEAELKRYLTTELSIAAINGSDLCVVAGTFEGVERLEALLAGEGHKSRRLHTSHAFHSSMMDPILERFERYVGQLTLDEPQIPFVSNLSGDWITPAQATSPAYWSKHLRGTVRFADGLETVLQDAKAVLIEVGPGNTLSTFARRHPTRQAGHLVVNLVRHPQEDMPDSRYLLQQIGRLWQAGAQLDWTAMYEGEKRLRLSLPTYSFEPTRYAIAQGYVARNDSHAQEKTLPVKARPERTPDFADTRNGLERAITELVQGHFGFETVGVQDNFFELGASSLDIAQLADHIGQLIGRELPVVTLYTYPNVQSLANHLRHDGWADNQQFDRTESLEGTQERLLKQLHQAPTSDSSGTGLEIAVVGMSGRFPGARNLNEFWENLKNGKETISFFSDEELLAEGIDPELVKHPSYVKARGALDDIELFDADFFEYSPREAEMMDPQFRLFHECAWEALEGAGYDPDRYRGLIGVYSGTSPNMSWISRFVADLNGTEQFSAMLLNDREFFSTQLSYKLNLQGPSVTMQTACSTSLVNIAMACQGLLTGSCDLALAGGSTVSIPQKSGYLYQDGMIQSPDGHCRPFDERAAGTVFGDGVGVVVLKRLQDAIRDGDEIHAVVKGFGLNNDGNRKVGYTAPSTLGQAESIRAAHRMAGVSPERIRYIEAHGTGTSVGDPIEMEALKLAFATEETGFCRLGSIKSNMGHLNAAAGIAGFFKTVLAMKHKLIPPTLHFETANPKIDFANSPFVVNTELVAWEGGGQPLLAGVSSFGIGGTNAHVVLEEAPTIAKQDAEQTGQDVSHLLVLSAKTPTALETAAVNLSAYLQAVPMADLADVAYTLQVGRKEFKYRKLIVAKRVEEAALRLADPSSAQMLSSSVDGASGQVVFLFSGQGSQYVNMGRELYETEATFRAESDRCFAIVQDMLGIDLKSVLYPGHEEAELADVAQRLNQTALTQPALFIFEYALSKLLASWGVRPHAMIGHSLGEYVAATLAGVFTLSDAVRLVTMRGQLMQEMPGGSMLSVPLSEADLQPDLTEELSVAAVNGSALCVVSGPDQAIDELSTRLTGQGIGARRLHTSHAFHSAMMEPILRKFEQCVRGVETHAPQQPFVSNVTGTWITASQATDPAYWTQHLRGTVRFADGLSLLLEDPKAIFVEVGAGNALSTFVHKHQAKQPGHLILNTVRHPQEDISDRDFLLKQVGRLWLSGMALDWQGLQGGIQRRRITLPTYPFERKRYWIEAGTPLVEAVKTRSPREVKNKMSEWFYLPSWERTLLQPLVQTKKAESSEGAWLIFHDDSALTEHLKVRLQRAGKTVITVKIGPSFMQRNETEYELNPAERQQYDALLGTLRARALTPSCMLHLWSIGEPDLTADDGLQGIQLRGYYSLVFLAQAISKQKLTDTISVRYITNGLHEVTGSERLFAEKATVLGPLKVIPQEYSNIRCTAVDIELPQPGSWQERALVEQLAAEVLSDAVDHMVAYRTQHRWVQSFSPIQLNKKDKPNTLKHNGVYLITGGLGSIGLVLSEMLAKRVQAKLILTGRSLFPRREEWGAWRAEHGEENLISVKIRKLEALEQLGTEVLTLQGDVSDEAAMRDILNQSETRFGRIDGVFHAAGLPGSTSFQAVEEIQRDGAEEQFRSKIYGLNVLQNVLNGRDIDFCLLFSSVASLLGGLGFSAYTAANAYMDAFAQRHNQQGQTPFLCVNWDAWYWGAHNSALGESLAELAIMPEEGVELFEYVLSDNVFRQLIVSTGSLHTRIEKWIHLKNHQQGSQPSAEYTKPSHARPALATAYVEPRNRMEKTLADIWQNYLGLEQVGVHDNFFELGASSLDIIQMTNRLNEILHDNIPVVSLFTYPTVFTLAEHLNKGQAQEAVTEDEIELFETVSKGKQRLRNQRNKRRKGDSDLE